MTATCRMEAPYPHPEAGQKRIVFTVDKAGSPVTEAVERRLQLIPGRTITMTRGDAINIRAFGGEIEERTVDGWGYEYYNVQLSEHAMSTRMMYTGEDANEGVRKFVPISRPKLVRYNSAAPVVVYLPEDAELRYSVWAAGEEMTAERE